MLYIYVLQFVCAGIQELLRWRSRRANTQRHHVVVDLPMRAPDAEGFEMEVDVAVGSRGAPSDELSDGSTLCGGSPPPPYSAVAFGDAFGSAS